MGLSAQPHERNGAVFAPHRQDYPDPRYYLSFTQVNFSCCISGFQLRKF